MYSADTVPDIVHVNIDAV